MAYNNEFETRPKWKAIIVMKQYVNEGTNFGLKGNSWALSHSLRVTVAPSPHSEALSGSLRFWGDPADKPAPAPSFPLTEAQVLLLQFSHHP